MTGEERGERRLSHMTGEEGERRLSHMTQGGTGEEAESHDDNVYCTARLGETSKHRIFSFYS